MLHTDMLALLIISLSFCGFLYVLPHFLLWMLTAEILWIGLYTSFIQYSALYDAVCLLICGLLILCLATSESAIGLSLILFNFTTTGNIHGQLAPINWSWQVQTYTYLNKS